MSSRDKAPSTSATNSKRATSKTTSTPAKATISHTYGRARQQTSPTTAKTGHKLQPSPSANSQRSSAKSDNSKTVIDSDQQTKQHKKPPQNRSHAPARTSAFSSATKATPSIKSLKDQWNDESSSSSQEMTMTSLQGEQSCPSASEGGSVAVEQETDIDRPVSGSGQETDEDESTTLLESASSSSGTRQKPIHSHLTPNDLGSQHQGASALPAGWEEHSDKVGVYYWHVPTGAIQRTRPVSELPAQQALTKDSIVLYHDDEEINQSSLVMPSRTSSEDDEFVESGAALTLADDATLSDAITFVVYPLGCCEFDETQLISANSTKAIQRCILRLSNTPSREESMCWGLDQSQPILMRLLDDHIQFTDINSQLLHRSQPIQTIKTWAVDDDNNFAFVVEGNFQNGAGDQFESNEESLNYALLNGPTFMCYVFSSMDDDDMSLKVATKLNAEIYRHKEKMSNRIGDSARLQRMIDSKPLRQKVANSSLTQNDTDQTDADEDLDDSNDDDDDNLTESSEMTLNVKYIGSVQVPRPMGIDVLNVAIDKCLADASKAQMSRLLNRNNAPSTSVSPPINAEGQLEIGSPLVEAKIHVSPSSVIVENEQTGEIIVECRIRYLTFMGISRRDIRWCGFIMQNTTNKTFVAHCFECHPTAGHVCEAIQKSCSRMYEKIVKSRKMKQRVDDATSIMPKSSKIRDTLAKTLSKIKLTPII